MAEEKNGVFRQKSLETISSPEQLGDYLRVTNPGIWALLAAIILLLGGLFVWSAAGNLETLADGVAVVEHGQAQITVTDSTNNSICSGMILRFQTDEYRISTVETDENGKTVAYAAVNEADGRYDVRIVTESIHPIQFLLG